MKDLEEHSGYWTALEAADYEFPGRLIIENENAYLYLTFDQPLPKLNKELANYQVIHGRTTSGKRISLLNCFDLSTSWSSAGLGSRKVLANYVLVGGFVPKLEGGRGRFRSMTLTWPRLKTFFGTSGIETSMKQEFGHFEIKYSPPEPLTVNLDENVKLDFSFGADTIPFGGAASDKISFSEILWVTATPCEPQDLEYFLSLLSEIRDFFSLCYLEYSPPSAINMEGNFDPREIEKEKTIYPRLSLHMSDHLRSESDKRPHPIETLLSIKTLENNFPQILTKWHKLARILSPIRSLYFSSLYGQRSYLEAEFLSLVQATEVFHRRIRGGTYLPIEKYMNDIAPRLQAALPSELDKETKEIYEQRLVFMNEYSLGKRIKDLAKEHLLVISTYIPDWKKTIKGIVDARNYYTHYSETSRVSEPDPQTLYEYRNFLRILLELGMLSECGIESHGLQNAALNCQKYRRIFQIEQRRKNES